MPQGTPTVTIDPAVFDAVIFDLDGVVTRTAEVHAAAWKELFDRFLARRAETSGRHPFVPFDADVEYREHVDGKPRYDGVRDLLQARGIELPWGDPADPPGRETVCGLGNLKNELFRQRLQSDGVAVYQSTVALIEALRAARMPTALVTSSKNGERVLDAAGLTDSFAVRLDGVAQAELGLAGKPAPDIFVEAARQLGVPPRRAVVFEDAESGVEAGRRGGFGLVVGVARAGDPEALNAHADLVVDDLSQVHLAAPALADEQRRQATAAATSTEERETVTEEGDAVQNKPREQRSTTDLPPALADDGLAAAIRARLSGRRMALFLDYDGTLTPIVERPEQAVLAAEVRQTLRRLARRCPVAVVSGRALADVRALVALETVYYAGSHGYRIEGPTGSGIAHRAGRRFAPAVEQAVAELRRELSGVEGTEVERKAVAVAVHYRRVAGEQHAAVERAVRRVADDHRGQLVLSRGKMVHELRPDIDWHKGKAVLWLLEALDRDGPDGLAIYIGDDTTDEDAFRALAEGDGLGIVVRDAAEPRATAASYALDSPGEVHRFLERVAGALRGVRR